MDTLIARQGGQQVLYGSSLALTATLQAWARHTDTPVTDLTPLICWPAAPYARRATRLLIPEPAP